MDIKVAAAETKQRIENRINSKLVFPKRPISLTYDHIIDMLERVASGEITGEKAHRWLGWAQCASVSAGVGTLEEMKNINHAA